VNSDLPSPDVTAVEATTLTLELESRPETPTLVRGMLGGIAELLAMDAELLDDVKTAVSEACNNVVLHAYPDASGLLTVALNITAAGIEVVVRDHGIGISEIASDDDRVHGVGLPVIRALAQRADFRNPADGGTEVWMLFPARRDGHTLFECPDRPAPDDGVARQLTGDAVVSVSPVQLLSGVLGRLSRALAASARFSLDRFSDVYLVTDAIAAHGAAAANGPRIGFSIKAGGRRLELIVGPFRQGSGEQLRREATADGARSPLSLLTDELEIEPADEGEMLRLVMIDHRRWPGA
jgi:anti-sigma regulatory factor (Ser/Thr protein kinase)